VLKCVAVCCSVLQCVAVSVRNRHRVLDLCVLCVAIMCCSVLQCVVVCCSVLQRVAACCSVLHRANIEIIEDLIQVEILC